MPVAFQTIPREFVSKTSVEDYKAPLTGVLADVQRYGAVVITRRKKYYGIIDDRQVANKGKIEVTSQFPTGKFTKVVPVLDQNTSIQDAIAYFHSSATKALPYVEGSKIVGVVKRNAILRAILSLHLVPDSKVEEIMSAPLLTVDDDDNLAQARRAMAKGRVGRLIVISDGKLFGMLTYKHMLKYSARTREKRTTTGRSTPEGRVRVGDVCERNVISIDREVPVDNAIRELVKHDISSLLVTKDTMPVGIVTARDILESVLGRIGTPEEHIVVSGLDAQSQEYKDDIVDSILGVIAKVDRFKALKVDNVSVNFKRVRTRGYEIRARLELRKGKEIYAAASGFTLERTLKELESTLYKEIRSLKNRIVTGRRELDATND